MAKGNSKPAKTSAGLRRSSSSTKSQMSQADRMLAKQKAAIAGKKVFVTLENTDKSDPSKLMIKVPYVGKFGGYIQSSSEK